MARLYIVMLQTDPPIFMGFRGVQRTNESAALPHVETDITKPLQKRRT